MLIFYYFYYFALLFICHMKYLQANECYECNLMFFNYTVTINTLPSPTRGDCKIKPSDSSCYVSISWYDDGTSSVAYSADAPFSSEVILIRTKRSVNASSFYMSQKLIGYSCMSSKSNTTPCNSVDKLKRSIIAASLPSDEQIKQFDALIAPTQDFNSSSCFIYVNLTDICPRTDLTNCHQCEIITQNTPNLVICATCPSETSTENMVGYGTLFYLNNRTEDSAVAVTCQTADDCNSLENVEQIKQNLPRSLDYDKFFSSTGSSSKLTLDIFLASVFIFLFHLY